jgi:hypothetical protein
MSDRELEGKFRDQAASVLTDADANALLAAVWTLDEAGSAEALFAWTAIGGGQSDSPTGSGGPGSSRATWNR